MKQLLKILLHDWPFILLAVVFLALQAYSELELPEYTSDIVNVGIQQSGVDETVPETILTAHLLALVPFAGSDGQAILDAYDSAGDVSNLKALSEDELTALGGKMAAPMVMSFAVTTISEMASSESESAQSDTGADMFAGLLAGESSDGGGLDFDPSLLKDPAALAQVLPQLLPQIKSQIEALDATMLSQLISQYIQGEYAAAGVDLGAKSTDYMINIGMMMLLFSLLSMIAAIVTAFLSSRIGAKIARSARSAVFAKVLAFSNKEYGEFSTASLITRSTNDIQQIQMTATMMLRMMIYAPIMGFGALDKVMSEGNAMSWVIAVSVAALLLLMIAMFIFALPKFQIIQKLVDKLNLVSREILTGLSVIRAFAREDHERKRFDKANLDVNNVLLFVNKAMALLMPTMMFIMNGTTILIIWAGAHQINSGTMQVGSLMAFIAYTMQIIMSFLVLSMMSVMLPRSVVAVKRVAEVLGKEIIVTDPKNPVSFPGDKKACIEFRDVSFKYGESSEYVLRHISFASGAGETTAIIGSTGSGKSTLAHLIPRFYDVTQGEILIDGVDIRSVTLHDLREKIGFVPQKAVLFSGTIAENLAYGFEEGQADDETMRRAAEIAQATEFIEEKQDKYDSYISEGGSNVSGGQKQRLSIARALAKNPEVYVFDDSFSALDFKTDVALRKALGKVIGQSTVIIITQRVSTAMQADRILVLDEGETAGIGTHQSLLKDCEVYRDIAYSQLSEDELQ
jgi:ATP-binding cassette subfamily B protein